MLNVITEPLTVVATQMLSFIPSLIAFLVILVVGRYIVKLVVKLAGKAESVASKDRLGFDLSNVIGKVLTFFVWYFALSQFLDLQFVIDFIFGSLGNIITLAFAGFALAFALSKEGQEIATDTVIAIINKLK